MGPPASYTLLPPVDSPENTHENLQPHTPACKQARFFVCFCFALFLSKHGNLFAEEIVKESKKYKQTIQMSQVCLFCPLPSPSSHFHPLTFCFAFHANC